MRFALTSDQEFFAKTIRDLLGAECSSEALRSAWEGDGRIPGLLARLVGLGVTALGVPEAAGGLGGNETDLLPLMIESGRACLTEPLMGALVAARILGAEATSPAATWLPSIAQGRAVVGLGVGPGSLVMDATVADVLLLTNGTGLYAVPVGAVEIEPEQSADRSARLGSVRWTPNPDERLSAAPVDALDGAALAAAAQLLGLGQGLLDMSVTYAGQREQFGRAIGSFQAVKHQLAEVYIGLAFVRPLLDRAAWSMAHRSPTRSRDVSMANHAAGEAAERAARVALQVHGGIGYTYEHDLHMWAKRAWFLTRAFGDAAWHRARVATLVLDDDQPRVP